jgi:hypothetical protein
LDGPEELDRVRDDPMQDVQARRGHFAARAGWRGLLPPAAASRGQAGRGPAASQAAQADEAMAPERAAAGRARVRMGGRALAESDRLRARAALAVRRSGLMCRVARAPRDSVRAARVRGRSGEPAQVGSPSLASIKRAQEASPRPGIDPDPNPGPRRAVSRSRDTGESRPGRARSVRVRGRVARSREADGLSCGGRFPRPACGTRSPGTP